MFLSDNGIFRKRNKDGTIWSLSLSAAVFYLTPGGVGGLPFHLETAAFRDKSPSSNLSAQVIRQEQPLSEKAALKPGLGGMAHGIPPEMDGRILWRAEPEGVPRMTEDTGNRALRLKTLGNAVCPPQAYPIFQYIAMIETGACVNICPLWNRR